MFEVGQEVIVTQIVDLDEEDDEDCVDTLKYFVGSAGIIVSINDMQIYKYVVEFHSIKSNPRNNFCDEELEPVGPQIDDSELWE